MHELRRALEESSPQRFLEIYNKQAHVSSYFPCVDASGRDLVLSADAKMRLALACCRLTEASLGTLCRCLRLSRQYVLFLKQVHAMHHWLMTDAMTVSMGCALWDIFGDESHVLAWCDWASRVYDQPATYWASIQTCYALQKAVVLTPEEASVVARPTVKLYLKSVEMPWQVASIPRNYVTLYKAQWSNIATKRRGYVA